MDRISMYEKYMRMVSYDFKWENNEVEDNDEKGHGLSWVKKEGL